MTDPRDAAEVLARARARSPRGRAPPATTTPDTHDEPRAGSREDLGHVHAPAPRKRPPTDLEYLQSLAPAIVFEGVERIDCQTFGPWVVTLRRSDGRAHWSYGPDRETALRRARRWADGQVTP